MAFLHLDREVTLITRCQVGHRVETDLREVFDGLELTRSAKAGERLTDLAVVDGTGYIVVAARTRFLQKCQRD